VTDLQLNVIVAPSYANTIGGDGRSLYQEVNMLNFCLAEQELHLTASWK
jgi:hypothetical protein